jgi:hypothetical protein
MRFCNDCDQIVHSIVYKQSHVRTRIAAGAAAVSATPKGGYNSNYSQQRLVPREQRSEAPATQYRPYQESVRHLNMESARREHRAESPLIVDLTASKKKINLAASQTL